MMSMSKTLLLSTVALTVGSCFSYSAFASVQGFSNIRKSGIPAHTHITPQYHTREIPNLSSRIFDKISTTGRQVVSVCFITDAGNCSGDKFGNIESPIGGGSGGGTPNGNGGDTSSGNSGENANDNIPEYDTIPEQCRNAGYTITSCPAGAHLENPCPSDNFYYQRCDCNANLTQVCTKPYYGVGVSCGGKYASCQRDDDKACRGDGYSQTSGCSSVQTPNKVCPYNSSYHDKCVCKSTLVRCTSPQSGVGESCDGKYASCKCPDNFKSCDCGGAVGATSCTINGKTTYSSCKSCCETSCPSGYSYSIIPEGYVQDGDACNHCSLGLRYKIKPNPCTGFQKCQYGPTSDAQSCLSASTKLYDKCRPCDNSCPTGTTESNPGGCGGSTTNECGTKTCYYPYQECCTWITYCASYSSYSCWCRENSATSYTMFATEYYYSCDRDGSCWLHHTQDFSQGLYSSSSSCQSAASSSCPSGRSCNFEYRECI